MRPRAPPNRKANDRPPYVSAKPRQIAGSTPAGADPGSVERHVTCPSSAAASATMLRIRSGIVLRNGLPGRKMQVEHSSDSSRISPVA